MQSSHCEGERRPVERRPAPPSPAPPSATQRRPYARLRDCQPTCALVQAALEWKKNEGEYRDDITAIVVYLQSVTQTLTQNEEH
jgi:hypothetical protein